MSTMLKTAAMTLLSKTLQTFLYKYLLDVDVEGVALPSLYDSDGHSGWGVRLCNVKLREGVELMEVLPGAKRTTKTRRVRRRRVNKRTTTTKSQKKTTNGTRRQEQQEQQQPSKTNHHHHQGNESNHSRSRIRRSSNDSESTRQRNQEDLGDESESRPLLPLSNHHHHQLHHQQLHHQQQQPQHPFDHGTSDEQENGTMEQQTVAESDTDDDDDNDAVSYVSSHMSSGPPTPPSSGGFLSNCFASSTVAAPAVAGISPKKPKRKHVKVLEGHHLQQHAIPNLEDDDELLLMTTSTQGGGGPAVQGDITTAGNTNTTKTNMTTSTHSASGDTTKSKKLVDDDEHDYDDDDETEEEEEVVEEEDEEYIFEEKMGLRLGKGGRIGVLDVRLIGKDLHVLVEDAFLTVEAVPKEPSYVDDGKKKDAAKPADKAAADAAKKAKEPKTVGDKVMAENPFARALAAIPHLFLRDIRIRFIMRDQSNSNSSSSNSNTNKSTAAPVPSTTDEYDDDIGERDCALEFGIEFLSVASGEDLLGQFRTDDENATAAHHHHYNHHEAAAAAAAASADEKNMHTSFSSLSELQNAADQHEYLSKRIRTGKGPEGGIWLKIIPPRWKLPSQPFPVDNHNNNGSSNNPSVWARQHFLNASHYTFFRCSGLDIRTRIYLGTKKEIAIMNNEYVWYGNEYDEYTLDSLLYGVDYISTGSQPPLPPMVERKDSMSSVSADKNNRNAFQIDDNGIYSCPMKSSFHRVARGLKPSMCRHDHLPSDDCPHCWERQQTSAKSHGLAQQLHHALDSSLPMPGLMLNLSMKDPIEVNVDRPGLDVLGLVLQIFTPGGSAAATEEPPKKADTDNKTHKGTERKKSITGLLLRGKDRRKNDLRNSFPTYMQPQSIQVTGLYLSKIFVRIHVMRREDFDDLGLKFCYWDVEARCVTADFQELKAREQLYQDARFDVGGFVISEFKGTERKELVSLGVPYAGGNVERELLSRFTSPESLLQPKSAWPSTASVLLHVPPPLDSHLLESRDRHALQARYFNVSTPGSQASEAFSHANIRLGVTSVNMPFAIKDDILSVIEEAMASIFGRRSQEPAQTSDAPPNDDPKVKVETTEATDVRAKSTIRYKLRIDGGEINVFPLISLRLPLTQLSGTQSSELGVFLETCLEKLQMQYGVSPEPPASGKGAVLDLQQLAALPESVRLRILFCLKDLKPLEKALGVKKESNSFLRCRAVNKGLVKTAKRVMSNKSSKPQQHPHQRSTTTSPPPTRTRQQLLTELLKLDNHALSDLLSTHELQQNNQSRR